jgi:hypothetical protein
MSVQWLQPLAWWGLGLLALPILIHLLARHRSRRLRFPSLKFLPVEQVAALRRRVIADWPLLAVRLVILAAAVAALAAPVVVSDARRDAWDRRVARAVVTTSPQTEEITALVAEAAEASYVSAVFAPVTVADGLREAERWLDEQPPAAREIVVVGHLREGALAAHDVARLPPYVGIRFLPLMHAEEDGAMREWRTMADGPDGAPMTYMARVSADVSRTHVRYEPQRELAARGIRVAAAPADQPHADAVLRAVLREGLVLGPDTDRAVTIAFEGADLPGLDRLETATHSWMLTALEQTPHVRGGELEGVLVVRPQLPVTDARAPQLVADVLRTAFAESRVALEPRPIPAAALAAWSRPHGASPDGVVPADEGDRRWFWGVVLLMLALEHVIRRGRRVA